MFKIDFKFSPLACVKHENFDAFTFARRLSMFNDKIAKHLDKNGLQVYSPFCALIPYGFDTADEESELDCYRLPKQTVLGKVVLRI